ncbi:MAG: LysR substrate-binding domain-containing protein [Pseudomonadota bacterium]
MSTKLPPLRAIHALEVFGRLGSVTKAAEELGVSAGAVSQQIRKAEDSLGMPLLERRGRSVALNSWGRLYHAAISRGFAEILGAQKALERARAESVLTISCLPSLASKWLAPQLVDWQTRHDRAVVRLIGAEDEPRFGTDPVDFRISYGGKAREFEHYADLFTDWVVPACAPALLRRHPVKAPADILKAPLLRIEWDHEHRSPPGWPEWAQAVGVAYTRKKGELAFSLSSAALDAAVNGRGFVLAQLSMAADDILSGRLVVPFNTRIRLPDPYFLAWERTALQKPLGAALRNWIIAAAKKQAAASAKHINPSGPGA